MRTGIRGVATVVAATAVVAMTGAAAAAGPGPVVASVAAGTTLATLGPGAVGANTPLWNPALPTPGVPELIRRAGLGTLEYNGGPASDLYHWRTNTVQADPDPEGHGDYSDLVSRTSFAQFVEVAHRSRAGMLMHVNYGTGTPAEAAAWVRYANRVKHDGVRDWAIGEEVWGNGGLGGINFEPDGHADKSPAAYGHNALAFIAAMKAADPHIRVGVELIGVPFGVYQQWDATVLSIVGSAVDFVDFHYYPFGAADTSDAGLLSFVRGTAGYVEALRALVDRYAGGRHVDIVAGETNSGVTATPQGISPFNALYLADDLFLLLEGGASQAAVWALHNGGYGANRGDLGLLSTGDCNDDNTVCAPPENTPYPPYYGVALAGGMARAGGRVVPVTTSDPLVVGHAVREADGSLAVLLINEDPAQARQVRLDLTGYRAGAGATVLRYAAGDPGIRVSHEGGPVHRLPAYSLTEVILHPGR